MAGYDDAAQPFDARGWRRAPTLARFLAAARPLTRPERRRIVDQAIRVLRDYYVHLPMKQASHGIEPIRHLEVLRRRLPEIADDVGFHERLHAVFASLRDLHTNYLLPEPFAERIAFLPFQIAAFTEDGKRRYLVTHVLRGLGRTRLRPPRRDRAVERNADGARGGARRAGQRRRQPARPARARDRRDDAAPARQAAAAGGGSGADRPAGRTGCGRGDMRLARRPAAGGGGAARGRSAPRAGASSRPRPGDRRAAAGAPCAAGDAGAAPAGVSSAPDARRCEAGSCNPSCPRCSRRTGSGSATSGSAMCAS